MTIYFANSPSVTALCFAVCLPRCVRGPVDRFEFMRFASIVAVVTVFLSSFIRKLWVPEILAREFRKFWHVLLQPAKGKAGM